MLDSIERSKALKLENLTVDQHQQLVEEFLTNSTLRRLIWMFEKMASVVATEITDAEKSLIHAERFQHQGLIRRHTNDIKNYEEDFKFMFSLFKILMLKAKNHDNTKQLFSELFPTKEKE